MKTTIHIPRPDTMLASAIDAGSAVVLLGQPRPEGVVPVTWESRGFNERVPSTFADRAERAWERSREIRNDLRKLARVSDLQPIGRFDTLTGELEIEFETDAADLATWLGCTRLDPAELTTTKGILVQMVRASMREHGDHLGQPAPAKPVLRSVPTGAGKGWHSR